MVEKLCTHYGTEICEIEGRKYYAFPEVNNLADPKVLRLLVNLIHIQLYTGLWQFFIIMSWLHPNPFASELWVS